MIHSSYRTKQIGRHFMDVSNMECCFLENMYFRMTILTNLPNVLYIDLFTEASENLLKYQLKASVINSRHIDKN